MTVLELAAISLGVTLVYMVLIWLVSLRLRNASIVDIFWGLGFVTVAIVLFGLTDGYSGRKVVMAFLVTVWGLRLSTHIFRRNWGHGEDYRYRAWREAAGAGFWWVSLFRVFLLQGVVLWIVSMPILAAFHYDRSGGFTVLDVAGVVVWAVGFFFEAVGDFQLERFKADPRNRGKVMDQGLWRYTRHPNYFGDATVWWGHFLIAAATVNGLWTVFSPVLMTFLLVRVSGVSLLEKKQVETKPGYVDYVRSTSSFIPWPPRHGASGRVK